MRALAPILLLAVAPAFADSEARVGADWVRIAATPCTDEKVLAHITAAGDNPLDYRAARAEFQGAPYIGCWRPLMDKGVVYIRYDDGDQGVVPFGDLKPLKTA